MGMVKKKVTIVSDEKTLEFANYIRQLISVNDDKDDEIIGVEDGSVETAVWTEKEYLNNKAKLSSNQHILFVGDNKVSKSETACIDVKYNMFGMKYGWLGKTGMIQVNKKMLSPEEYEVFISYCRAYEIEFNKIVMKKKKKPEIEDKEESKGKLLKNGFAVGAVAVAAVFNPLVPIVAIPGIAAIDTVNKVVIDKKVKEQQYRALSLIMYLDALKEFLEE